ncbi:hypothetical protein [Pseudomonas sp. URIL14HWK12:I5]|uniref:hypothetical protein n=1 Tax=Pseudomonas sp. URIL14HWK12:I5 TaxID=1261630 RepID=UPI0009D8E9F7|nr:hypothetical protein [Pseudomonas sp. URIL14HWK12:I5]SMD13866.1 hypothetical protein SAMN05660385_04730 [Pseudomonas sp. URIL14HWK12:I5]
MQQDDPFAAIGSAAPLETSSQDLKKAQKEESVLEDPKQKVQKEVHSLAIYAIRFGAILFAVLILVRFWHLAGPGSIFGLSTRWLSDTELQSMDKMLFSSAFGGLILGYMKDLMGPSKKD